MRIVKPLNFNWYFAKKMDNLTIDDMTLVNIPHSNIETTLTHVNELDYQFESVYKKKLDVNKAEDKRYFIEFDGVLHKASLSVNDLFVGEHLGGYTRFKFEITHQLKEGENWITVDVDSRESLNIPPFGKTIDYLTYGGIYREVRLIETPQAYIEDVRIHTKNLLTDPTIDIEVVTTGGKQTKAILLDQQHVLVEATANIGSRIRLQYPVTLWDIDQPKLYDIEIWLDDDDHMTINTGFKEAEFRKDGFYLNGKNVKINGLNRHQIYPHVGYAMPKSAQVLDAKILKETVNTVRTSHYPQSHHFINACDALGLLVFMEAPGWQFIGDDLWKENYKFQVKCMVREFRHHPSIILWGVRVNESADDHNLYDQTNQIARLLDDRPTGGVRCFSFSEELEDVYTYNDFIHSGHNVLLKPKDEVFKQDRPYVITEFNGHMFPTKTFDHAAKRLEHALRYANIMNAYMGDELITGAFGWQYIDYNTHKEFGAPDRVCYHGVYDMFRLPKQAAHVYRSQISDIPYMAVLNGMDIGDYEESFVDHMYVASNCDMIEVYQNERFIGEFYPDKVTFPHLKHPLFVINDFYGDAYQMDLGISKQASQSYIKMAHDVAKRGGLDKLTKEDYIDRKSLNIGWQMYGKYVANWGSGAFTYTLKGHYKDQIIERKIGPYQTYTYDIQSDQTDLYIEDTYDVQRITIQAIDNLGQEKPYCFDGFSIETNGSIELIGPSQIALIGGRYAFWIKSKEKGKGTVHIKNYKIDRTLTFQVY